MNEKPDSGRVGHRMARYAMRARARWPLLSVVAGADNYIENVDHTVAVNVIIEFWRAWRVSSCGQM